MLSTHSAITMIRCCHMHPTIFATNEPWMGNTDMLSGSHSRANSGLRINNSTLQIGSKQRDIVTDSFKILITADPTKLSHSTMDPLSRTLAKPAQCRRHVIIENFVATAKPTFDRPQPNQRGGGAKAIRTKPRPLPPYIMEEFHQNRSSHHHAQAQHCRMSISRPH